MGTLCKQEMLDRICSQQGFLAALDQSGGSTPKALGLYGIEQHQYANDEEMFAHIHAMRARIVTSPAFEAGRVLGAILFEHTLDNDVDGMPSAKYLWQRKGVVPFLKVDKGLADEINGVQLMKPMPGLPDLLAKANATGVFGTKMRSVIKSANSEGIAAVVAQQFEIGQQIIAAGLVPIIEPEVDINAPDKSEAEVILRAQILEQLDRLSEDQNVMLKLTLPSEPNFYADCIEHPRVIKVVALSGGYSRDVANTKVAQNPGMIASFSRALTEGLNAKQTDEDFTQMLDSSIQSIYQASLT